jgi:hypothetical protein
MIDTKMTVAFVLIGLAAVAAGLFGLRLPPGDRIAAGLSLVVGAGVGVVALAIGTNIASSDSVDTAETVFLVAAALGFLATMGSLYLLWRRTERGGPTSQQG